MHFSSLAPPEKPGYHPPTEILVTHPGRGGTIRLRERLRRVVPRRQIGVVRYQGPKDTERSVSAKIKLDQGSGRRNVRRRIWQYLQHEGGRQRCGL